MPNNSQLVAVSIPAQVNPGQQFEARLTFLNTGDKIWVPTGTNLYGLGSHNPSNNTDWGLQRLILPNSVSPGQSVEFVGQLTAPQQQGFRSCQWRMLEENIEWFGQAATPFVYVGQPAVTASSKLLARAPASADDLVGGVIADTSPVMMDGLKRIVRWTNTLGVPLKIWKAYVWSGVQAGSVADVHAELVRTSDGALLAMNQWDRYAEPTAPNNGVYVDFPKPVLLAAGDSLDLLSFAIGYNGAERVSHHLAAIWATV